MPYELVVTRPFEGREIGSRVTDQADIDRIMAPGHNHNVVRVWVEPDADTEPSVEMLAEEPNPSSSEAPTAE